MLYISAVIAGALTRTVCESCSDQQPSVITDMIQVIAGMPHLAVQVRRHSPHAHITFWNVAADYIPYYSSVSCVQVESDLHMMCQ